MRFYDHMPQWFATLRSRAEAQLSSRGTATEAETGGYRQQQHLELLNTELELQNEDLRASEVALLSSRERLSGLLQLASVGYAVMEHDSIVREANPTLATLLGVNPGQLIGRPLVAHVTESSAMSLQRQFSETLRSGTANERELVLELLHGGPTKFVKVVTTPVDSVTGPKLWAVFTDSTSSWRASRLDERTGTLLRQLLEHIEDAVFVVDRGSRSIDFVNPAFESILGRSIEVDTARTDAWLDWVHPDDVESVVRSIRNYHHGDPFDLEFRVRRPDGRERWIHARAFPITGNGTIESDIWLLRDITEDRLLSFELAHAQKLEGLGTLAASITHDFNNVIQGIIGSVQLALRNRPSPTVRRHLDHLLRAARRGAELAEQLTSRVRKSEPCPRSRLGLDDNLGGLVELARRLVDDGIQLSFHPSAPEARVLATLTELEQILFNLVVNARDAMPQGGTLRIETQLLRGERDETSVRITVSDTGEGMDSATLARACEPFFTTKAAGHGTGLGLATIQRLVDSLSGKLVIGSHPGRGTNVSIELPCTLASVRDTRPFPRVAPLSGTVLLVDPDPLARESTARGLEALGLTVYAAIGAADALEWCARTSTFLDVLITETALPTCSGRELAERVSALKPAARIVFSMSSLTPADEAARLPGVVLRKPFDHESLAAAVAADISDSTPCSSTSSSSHTILLVDDHPATRIAVGEFLEEVGYRTITASSLAEAQAVAQDVSRLDVVLCDARLPDGNGSDLAQALEQNHPETRLIFMSGGEYAGAGADAFIQKPFELDALASVVGDVLRLDGGPRR